MPLQHAACGQHRGLADLLVGVVGVGQDVVAHELQKLDAAQVKRAYGGGGGNQLMIKEMVDGRSEWVRKVATA